MSTFGCPRRTTARWLCSVIGRSFSTMMAVGPRTSANHSPMKFALPIVAERATKRTAGGREDDDLLPDPAAKRVLEVVDFVEDDEAERLQLVRLGEQHVAQHLGRHDHDLGAGIDRHVAGEESDAALAVEGTQFAVLLIRECLQRCGVERPLPALEDASDGVVGDQRLARTGRRAHEHVDVLVHGVEGLDLKPVQTEGEAVDESTAIVAVGHFFNSLPTPIAKK